MQRKITWLVLSLIVFAIVSLAGGYYLYFFKNQETPNGRSQGEKEFLEFLAQKKKFFQNSEVVLRQEEADLDNNLIKEIYILENGRLIVSENSKIVWQSPSEWWIDNFVLVDSNNDEIPDINLSLWKAGNFGSSKPFWVKENDMSVKNHFFILDFINGAVKQVWGSSNLVKPNCEFQIVDIDDDGKNDLVVIEGDYSQKPKCSGSYVAVWEWNDWGFSNEWRSDKGNFSGGFTGFKIDKIDKKMYIIADAL